MELKFDNLIMDTSLAQDYLKTYKEFNSFGSSNYVLQSSGSWTVYDNKIMYVTMNLNTIFDDIIKNVNNNDPEDTKEAQNKKFQKLAIKITEKKKLFAQLEYMIRGIPIEDTYLQLDLIIKQLMCSNKTFDYNFLALSDNAPLLGLGCVANLVPLNNWYLIFTTKDTAVISHLFTHLCHEVGLKNVYLVVTKDECIEHFKGSYKVLNLKKVKEQISGTVGVIAQHSDVDSAIDMFLESSSHNPWKLRKIFVQESIYQHFKETLNWKCGLKNIRNSKSSTENDFSAPYEKSESAIISYNNKVFLLDYIDSKSNAKNLSDVTVEAYRTTKELFTLLDNTKPYYISLWANDVVEMNEIAYTVKSPVVWLNNYADFRGPDEICSFIYNVFKETRCVKKSPSISELYKLSASWSKLSFAERSKILFEVIDKYMQSKGKTSDLLMSQKLELLKSKMNAIVDVGNNYVCTIIDRPVGIIEVSDLENIENIEILRGILLGNAIAFSKQESFIDIFVKAGIPACFVDFEFGDESEINKNMYSQTKVIWNNFGTIFAN